MQGATYTVDATAGAGGDGSERKPFATIQQAADVLGPGDVCVVRAGTYRETVVLRRSGTREKPIVFRAAEDADAVVTGCEPVGGWKRDQGNVYYTDTGLTAGHENQVFCDGRMMWEARWPDAGGRSLKFLLEFKTATMGDGTTPTRIKDSRLPQRDWSGAQVWVSSHKRWYCWTGQVTGHGKGWIDVENRSDEKGSHVCKRGGRYYIFGTRAALDSENEWYYDAKQKRLYVWVPGGGTPANRVAVKRRMIAFDLRGRKHVTLRNITITASTVRTDDESSHLLLDGLRVFHPYHSNQARRPWGAQTNTGVVLRGTQHIARNCEIAYASGSGLVLRGRDCRVINSFIHDCDGIGSYASPLVFGHGGSGHVVSHNTISRAGRMCVSTSGFYDCLFQYNDVSYAGFLTNDLGLTYGNGVEGGNSEVRYNRLHHNVCEHANMGLYFDHGCKNIIMHHNMIYGIRHYGMINNHYGNYLLYYNNTVSAGHTGYQSTWAAAQLKDLYGCRLVNTVSTRGIRVNGSGMIRRHNTWNYRKLVKGKYLTRGTGPVDSGLHVPGITDGYASKAPDRGAHELGRKPWKAGHDFETPPEQIDTKHSMPPHRNLLGNTAFYRGETDPWEFEGDDVTVVTDYHNQWETTGKAMMGGRSACLGKGKNRIQQTVSGLEPNTTYELMGMFRVEKGAQACLTVTLGGKTARSQPVMATNRTWRRRTLRFTTGPRGKTAAVIAEKTTAGESPVYVDDMGLQLVGAAK